MKGYCSINFVITNDFKVSLAGSFIYYILTCPGIFNFIFVGFSVSEINLTFYIAKHK